ncbi:MAG: hypothetical protein Q8L65_07605 [Burkholderiales bacterium]|nr:hypothetical protein [Burkholderiales bacterium]
MSGLAHFIERQGIPTVVVSLVREHITQMKPPRALHVPFQFGRPFGAPDSPDFQRRVLTAALRLLERCDGPLIEDFPESAPDVATDTPDDQQGWVCPVNFSGPKVAPDSPEAFRQRLHQEIVLLQPWYEESVRRQKGRRLDGLTTLSPGQIADHLFSYLHNQGIPSFVTGEPMARAIKLCADDLKHYYYQAALARPGRATGIAVDNWFFGDTAAGRLHIELRRLLKAMDDPALRRIGEMNLVPHAMLHHATD